MTLNLTIGSDSLTLCTEDVGKYPNSLLHSMLSKEAGASDSRPVTVKVAFLPGSPCHGWRDAACVTAALFRDDHLVVELLSELCNTNTSASPSDVAADVYDKLTALLDHLHLPGPVGKWLPARGHITLPHARIIELHYLAAVDTAVSTMLNSTAFSSGSISKDIGEQRAAFFYLTLSSSDANTVALRVFAVGGAELQCVIPSQCNTMRSNPASRLSAALSAAGLTLTRWLQALRLPGIGRWMQFLDDESSRRIKLSSAVTVELPEATAGKAVMQTAFNGIVWGSNSGDGVRSTHSLLWPMILNRLQRGISSVCTAGCSGGTNVGSIRVDVPQPRQSHGQQQARAVPLWVVYW